MAKNLPTVERLLEVYAYNPDSGVLARKATMRPITCTNSRGYIVVNVDGVSVSAHRIIMAMMTGAWPNIVDHINHCKTDNRWINLRNVSRRANSLNRKKKERLGTRIERSGRITARCVGVHIGTFSTMREA